MLGVPPGMRLGFKADRGARADRPRQLLEGLHGHQLDAAPASIVEARGDRLVVACGEGTALAVTELQPEGKRAMSAREFLAGRRLAPGAALGRVPPA